MLILEKISITFLCSLGTAKHLTGCCNYKLAVYLLTIRSMVVVSCMSNASKPHLQSADQEGRQSLWPSRHQGSLSRQSTKVSTVQCFKVWVQIISKLYVCPTWHSFNMPPAMKWLISSMKNILILRGINWKWNVIFVGLWN